MFGLFGKKPDQLLREDSPDRLVLDISLPRSETLGKALLFIALVSGLSTIVGDFGVVGGVVTLLCSSWGLWLTAGNRSVTFDIAQRKVLFSTRHLLFEGKRKIIPFGEIAAVHLDYWERVWERGNIGEYVTEKWIRQKWTIFFALVRGQAVTVAEEVTDHLAEQTSILPKRLAYWEELAKRICALVDKPLIRSPSVPGPPHTFVEVIDQILQRHLAQSRIGARSVHLRSHEDGGLEIEIDGQVYRDLKGIDDVAVRGLIQVAVDEWQSNQITPSSNPLL